MEGATTEPAEPAAVQVTTDVSDVANEQEQKETHDPQDRSASIDVGLNRLRMLRFWQSLCGSDIPAQLLLVDQYVMRESASLDCRYIWVYFILCTDHP